jgi:hypothetical protein
MRGVVDPCRGMSIRTVSLKQRAPPHLATSTTECARKATARHACEAHVVATARFAREHSATATPEGSSKGKRIKCTIGGRERGAAMLGGVPLGVGCAIRGRER